MRLPLSKLIVRSLILVAAVSCIHHQASAQVPTDRAWRELPHYEYGQDMGVLLAIDRQVIEAMRSPESRRDCAARLAALLVQESTTLAAQQYICLQLRQIGTPAEVPTLAQLLSDPDTSEMARHALQAIPGPESATALRACLEQWQGERLLGAISSVAARQDEQALPALQKLADSPHPDVSAAAVRALGTIGSRQARSLLLARAADQSQPLSLPLALALLQCAARAEKAGSSAESEAIYRQLCHAEQSVGIRRAALEGILRLQKTEPASMIAEWLAGSDRDRAAIAAGHLETLRDEQLDALLDQFPGLHPAGQLAVLESAANRRGATVIPWLQSMLTSDRIELQLAGIRGLGIVGNETVIEPLLHLLGGDERVSAEAQNAMLRLPRTSVTKALLQALHERPEIREEVIGVLIKLTCYEAIDPLIEIAAQPDPQQYGPALQGLRGIADPDKTDIPRLVALLLKTEAGRHQDEVEKTIVLVTQKLPPEADHAALVIEALDTRKDADPAKYLPLLGRLGGAHSLARIQDALTGPQAERKQAAVRALCNWPTPDVAPQLLELAETQEDRSLRRWSLRAYVRVVTLASERPEQETLEMLKKAMSLANTDDDRRLILERTATVRSLEAVHWLATFIDNPELDQAACLSIVELAHHRFLRQPNKDLFDPLLEKITHISQDPVIVERARRYRLGL